MSDTTTGSNTAMLAAVADEVPRHLPFLQPNYPRALRRRRAEIAGIQGEAVAAKAHVATSV